VTVRNEQLDDMVLLRADGTPTYMLSVVVDDHHKGITDVIRGDDHLTNAFRQTQIYLANGWAVPHFSHIPLIHGPDGAKLSKRHGALAIEEYRDQMGYLPEALRNYLLRLGWGHGDDEIISDAQAIEWFDLPGIGRAPARLDYAKLDNLNGHYLRQADDGRLVELVEARIGPFNQAQRAILLAAMAGLKSRAKTVVELAENAKFYVALRPIPVDDKARALGTPEARALLAKLVDTLKSQADWSEAPLEAAIRDFVAAEGVKLGAVAQPLRAALAGATTSPGIFEVMAVLGRDEALGRIGDFAGTGTV
jgi:glutamyl-tRNA synthetase